MILVYLGHKVTAFFLVKDKEKEKLRKRSKKCFASLKYCIVPVFFYTFFGWSGQCCVTIAGSSFDEKESILNAILFTRSNID